MSSLPVAALLLALSGPGADPPPGAMRQADPDAAMLLARRAPLQLQPVALMVLDTAVPMAAAAAGFVVGSAAGAAAGGMSSLAVPSSSGLATATRAAAGWGAGGLLGLVLASLAADAVFNTFHAGHLLRTRLTMLGLLLPGPALMVTAASMERYAQGSVPLSAGLLVASLGAVMLQLVLAAPAALAVAVYARIGADQRDGTPLWEEGQPR